MEWKFDQMDENRDDFLTRKEFRNFRKAVKTVTFTIKTSFKILQLMYFK